MASKKDASADKDVGDGKGDKAPTAFLISRQLDQEKINFLTRRIEELLLSNKELRAGAGQNEKDTHDIVLYFQREMEIKDDIILKLNEELVKSQTQLKFEVDKIRQSFEDELAEVKGHSESTISSLTSKVEALEDDLKSVEVFRREKELRDDVIRRLERDLQQQREQLIDAMEHQERRFLEEKSRFLKDLDEQKAAFREVALQDARLAMGEEIKKIMAENTRMFEELKFHHSESVYAQAERKRLQTELHTSKREVAILADKEIEYAKQAHNRSKEIKVLRERVDQLEKQQATNIEKFKLRAKELKHTVTKELEEATLDAAGLRRLIAIKNKELKHMKSLAATILSQRTETEQFFLEALQEVKEIVKLERKRKLAEQLQQQQAQQQQATLSTHQQATVKLAQWNNRSGPQSGVSFPPLSVRPANIHLLDNHKRVSDLTAAMHNNQLEKVSVADLGWEDKELVLRVLFAKMNSGNVGAGGGGVSAAIPQGSPRKAYDAQQRAVFISEGVDLQPGMQIDLDNFALPQNGEQADEAAEYDFPLSGIRSDAQSGFHSELSSLPGSSRIAHPPGHKVYNDEDDLDAAVKSVSSTPKSIGQRKVTLPAIDD